MACLNTNLGSVFFSVNGKGTALVFLHGYLESISIWNDFTPFFDKQFQVVCVDLPGHGGSTIHYSMVTMEDMAFAIKQVLDQLGIRSCVFVGHSMGGYAALAYADLFPEMVAGLILLHSHPNSDTNEKIRSRIADVERIELGEKDKIVDESIPKLFANINHEKFTESINRSRRIAMSTSDIGVIAALRGMAARKDRNHVVENLNRKVLMVFGSLDNLIPSDMASGLSSKHPLARVAWLHNSGHMGFIEEIDQAAKAITSFLTELLESV